MKKIMTLLISAVLLATLAFSYDGDAENYEPQYYDDAKVLRVKYTQGEAYVRRSYDEGFEEAAINLPIFEKDVAGTTDGRLEIYLGRLNYLRLDYDTEVEFGKVPELRKTDMSLRVISGGIYLDIENLDFERDIEVQTPDCGVFLLGRGLYRINVNENGRTEVYVFDGTAEVAGENYSRNVRDNQKIVMRDGGVSERPFYFSSSDSDDFDQWSRDRNNVVGYARYSSSRYLDSGYEEYEYELSRNGRWQYEDTYRSYVWIPYNVGADWRPYYHGRWVWNPFYGYVWTSYDSWGFFTHHYGRWHWDPVFHWHWIPSYHWSPAWVDWFWDDHYYGWCPLSWWNRPVVVYNGRWWKDYHYRGGIPFHARSTTIIKKSHLATSGVHRFALKKGDISGISKKSLAFKGRGPKLRPDISRVDVINARGKSVVYKGNGIVSTGKYKVVKSESGRADVIGKKSVVYRYSGQKLSKHKEPKYSGSRYSTSGDTGATFRSYKDKSKSHKYESGKSSQPGKYGTSSDYKDKKYDSGSAFKSKKTYKSSSSKYRSGSSKSGKSTKSSQTYKSSSKKSSSKSSSKSSGTKVKKKKESPYYSSSYRSSSSSSSGGYSSSQPRTRAQTEYKSYESRSYTSNSNKKYTPSTSYKKRTPSYSSSSSYQSPTRSKSYGSYGSSSYQSKSSSNSSYKPSKSYSKSSSYKSSGSSYKSSPRSSSSSSRSSSSYKSKSSSSSSSGSSSSSYKKKK